MIIPGKIAQVREEMIKFAEENPGNKEKIRAETIKRLDDIIDRLPLSKSVIEQEFKQIKSSSFLQKIIQSASQKHELKQRLRRAIADLITDEVMQ